MYKVYGKQKCVCVSSALRTKEGVVKYRETTRRSAVACTTFASDMTPRATRTSEKCTKVPTSSFSSCEYDYFHNFDVLLQKAELVH